MQIDPRIQCQIESRVDMQVEWGIASQTATHIEPSVGTQVELSFEVQFEIQNMHARGEVETVRKFVCTSHRMYTFTSKNHPNPNRIHATLTQTLPETKD